MKLHDSDGCGMKFSLCALPTRSFFLDDPDHYPDWTREEKKEEFLLWLSERYHARRATFLRKVQISFFYLFIVPVPILMSILGFFGVNSASVYTHVFSWVWALFGVLAYMSVERSCRRHLDLSCQYEILWCLFFTYKRLDLQDQMDILRDRKSLIDLQEPSNWKHALLALCYNDYCMSRFLYNRMKVVTPSQERFAQIFSYKQTTFPFVVRVRWPDKVTVHQSVPESGALKVVSINPLPKRPGSQKGKV